MKRSWIIPVTESSLNLRRVKLENTTSTITTTNITIITTTKRTMARTTAMSTRHGKHHGHLVLSPADTVDDTQYNQIGETIMITNTTSSSHLERFPDPLPSASGSGTLISPSLQGGWLCDVDVTQDGQVWIGRTHLSQHLRWEKLNPISKFLLSLSALPKSRGVGYPIWFNSMFEFCQKMIHSIFDSISLYPRFNSKYYSIQKKFCWFNSKGNSIHQPGNHWYWSDGKSAQKLPKKCPK